MILKKIGAMSTVVACSAILAAMADQASAAPSDAGRCSQIKLQSFPQTRIRIAEEVVPNPSWPFPVTMYSKAPKFPKVATAPFCRVAGTIEQEIQFEVWLPPDWNGKFEAFGNGGFAGAVRYNLLNDGMMAHYAAASTDTGHVNKSYMFESDWIDGHPERVDNFVFRAHHLLAEIGPKIVAAYYGKPPQRRYFSGCSVGGWEGLTEARQYPQDYDGIIAGSPAINFVRHQTRGIWLAKLSLDDPAGDLSDAKVKLVVDAAAARCDAADGLKDGVINNPDKCDFNPAQLQCTGPDADSCLTAPQVKRAQTIWGRYSTAKGTAIFPGNAPGAMPAIVFRFDGEEEALKTPPLPRLAPRQDFNPAHFDPDRDIPALEKLLGAKMDGSNPDLSAYAKRGGKLIIYHGWNDPTFSPYNTLDYYRDVQNKVGVEATAQFSQLYMIPGMEHCRGGVGTDQWDSLAALDNWVEKGEAPGRVIASRVTPDGTVDRTRPLCPYPQLANYTGQGNPDDAANFVCAGP